MNIFLPLVNDFALSFKLFYYIFYVASFCAFYEIRATVNDYLYSDFYIYVASSADCYPRKMEHRYKMHCYSLFRLL